MEWGVDSPALWAMDVGNSERTAGDLDDKWKAMISTTDIVREILTSFPSLFLSFKKQGIRYSSESWWMDWSRQ